MPISVTRLQSQANFRVEVASARAKETTSSVLGSKLQLFVEATVKGPL